jgi:hypothetical protein
LRMLIDAGRPDIAQIHRLIGHHEALIVLDGVADVRVPLGVEELLAYCSGVRVISTSRASWHVAGVQGTVISPLATPGPEWDAAPTLEALAGVPSVRLLVDRLSEVRPGFALGAADAASAVDVCRRLDGLPLALEAVAGRFGVLSLSQLADVASASPLDLTVPGGQGGVPETIGGLISSSFYGLEVGHRRILRELARIEGPWTVSDAAAVLCRPLTEVVDELGVLMARGLVRASHAEQSTGLHVPNLLRAFLVR